MEQLFVVVSRNTILGTQVRPVLTVMANTAILFFYAVSVCLAVKLVF